MGTINAYSFVCLSVVLSPAQKCKKNTCEVKANITMFKDNYQVIKINWI